MALTVGELQAFLTLDSSGLDRGLAASQSKMAKFGSAAVATGKTVAGAFATAATTAGGLGLAVAKVGYDYNRLQQSSRAALSTLLGGAEKANAQMDKLDEFARSSPFAKQVFITAQQQLLGFGVAAEDVIPALDAIQNAVAAVGGSNEQIGNVTYALAQMRGMGKLTGETLRDLGIYGIDAATIVGESMGKTGAEIRELASKPGGIPVDQVWDPLVAGLMKRFGGATDNIKQQMDGAVDRIKGAWRDIGSVVAAPFVDPKGGGRAVEWANKVADLLRALETKAKPFVDIMLTRLGPGLNRITPTLDKMRGAVNGWDLSKVNGQLDKLVHYGPLVSALAASMFAFGSGSIPVLGRFVPALNPVLAGLAALVATSPELRAVGEEIGSALAPLVPVLTEVGRALADQLLAAIVTLSPAIIELVQAGAPLVDVLARGLGPALIDVAEGADPVVSALADVVRWVSDLPAPVLAAVAAFGALKALRVGAMFAPMTAAVRTFNEEAKLQAALAGSSSRAVGLFGAASVKAQAGVRGLGTAMKTAFISNPVGLALLAISTAVGYFAAEQEKAKAKTAAFRQVVDSVRDSLDQATGAITENTRATVFKGLVDDGTIAQAKELGLNLGLVTDAAMGNQDAIDRLVDLQRQYADASRDGDQVDGERIALFGKYQVVLSGVGVQTEALTAAQQQLRDEQAAGIAATERDTAATRENTDAKREAAGVALSLREAQLAAEDGQQRFTESLKRYQEVSKDAEATDDEKAAALRDVEGALLATVRNYEAVQDAMSKNNATGKELYDVVEEQRKAFVAQAEKMTGSREEAERLATAYGLIPKRVSTEIVANSANVAAGILEIQKRIDWLTGKTYTVRIRTDARVPGGIVIQQQGAPDKYDEGGAVSGGSPGRDSVHGVLKPGEHVLTDRDVTALGGQAGVYRMRGLLAAGARFFAAGGAVGQSDAEAKRAWSEYKAAQRRAKAARSEAARERAEEDAQRAKERYDDAVARGERLREQRRDLAIGVRRGAFTDAATGGLSGAYGIVDQLREMSRSGDFSRGTSDFLSREAAKAERSFERLYRQADRLEKSVTAARDRVSELSSIKSSASSAISGGFSLGSLFGQRDQWGYDKPVSKGSMLSAARGYASKVRAFAKKLAAVQKKLGSTPAAGAILQQIVGLGVEEGTVAADAVLSMDYSETKELRRSFNDIARWSNNLGETVTRGFYKGGLEGAEAILEGLEAKRAKLDAEMERIAKRLQQAMQRALSGAGAVTVTVAAASGSRGASAAASAGTAGKVSPTGRTLSQADAEAIGAAVAKNINGLAVKGEFRLTDRDAAALVQRGTNAKAGSLR